MRGRGIFLVVVLALFVAVTALALASAWGRGPDLIATGWHLLRGDSTEIQGLQIQVPKGWFVGNRESVPCLVRAHSHGGILSGTAEKSYSLGCFRPATAGAVAVWEQYAGAASSRVLDVAEHRTICRDSSEGESGVSMDCLIEPATAASFSGLVEDRAEFLVILSGAK